MFSLVITYAFWIAVCKFLPHPLPLLLVQNNNYLVEVNDGEVTFIRAHYPSFFSNCFSLPTHVTAATRIFLWIVNGDIGSFVSSHISLHKSSHSDSYKMTSSLGFRTTRPPRGGWWENTLPERDYRYLSLAHLICIHTYIDLWPAGSPSCLAISVLSSAHCLMLPHTSPHHL